MCTTPRPRPALRLPALLTLGLLVLASCATGTSGPPDGAPTSLRDRLHDDTRIALAPKDSAGVITAERHVHDGWEAGIVDLAIASGEVTLRADDTVAVMSLSASFAPIAIPPAVFGGHPATITNLHVRLGAPIEVPATWAAEDELHATAVLPLEMTWALTIDQTSVPLGSPSLPPVAVEIDVSGTGDHVHAELHLAAHGELWSWLDLVRLSDLSLVLHAATP